MQSTSKRINSLKAEHITKRFPGILALDDVSLSVERGEVLAVVGENGAGKTTLMNILMGLYSPDEGGLTVNGQAVVFRSPADAMNAGIGMVHQQYMLVPDMTVTENIALGMKYLDDGASGKKKGKALTDTALVRRKIDEVSGRYGLKVDPDAYIWQLSVGEQQKVELIKTLCLGADLLILDEPTSALTPQETDELIALLKRLAEDISIIFISHKLAEVKALSSRLVVLRGGKNVFAGSTSDYSAEDIAALMTGHKVNFTIDRPTQNVGHILLDIRNLKAKGDRGNYALDGFNLVVREGEIVGLAGVSGNGQKELAECINGLRKVESGYILLEGERVHNRSPRHIIDKGMGYIPEERNIEGIVPSMSIKENTVLKDIGSKRFSSHGVISRGRIANNAESLRREFDIRCSDTDVAAGSLSGGNIQKVILARELSRGPQFLTCVYPIRGLDMGAAEFIHEQLLDLRDRGAGILLISEEIDEIINLSDRIAVIFKGKVMKVLEKKEATARKLGILMAGVNADEE